VTAIKKEACGLDSSAKAQGLWTGFCKRESEFCAP